MLKPSRRVLALGGILLVAGILLGLGISRLIRPRYAGAYYNTPILLKEVQTLSQLVTVKYVMERAVVWDDPPKSLLGQMFAGENHILLLANGIVKAGVDLSKLAPGDLRVEGDRVVIQLPPARITDAYLDDSQTKVIERTTGFLRSFDKNLEQRIRNNAVQDLRRAAWRNGILRDADERARAQLKALFNGMGFKQVDFVPPDAAPDTEAPIVSVPRDAS